MFTLPQLIARLTKGYIKYTGKQPDGLASLKIKMEAAQKFKDQSKVVDFPKDKITNWTKKASGGLARVGMFKGLLVKGSKAYKAAQKKKLQKAYDEIAGGSGFTDDYKYDADVLADEFASQDGKVFADLSLEEQSLYYEPALERVVQDLKKRLDLKRLSKPTKTLEGIKKEGTIDISDPEVADEFTKFMKESDPKGYKDLEQKIETESFDVTGRKKNASGGLAHILGV